MLLGSEFQVLCEAVSSEFWMNEMCGREYVYSGLEKDFGVGY